ncbi:hypothetical protein [Reinekea sp. G2M2-21]|uniref:hypothetical protein n=1 Tax=Reinekea sp. G2M2-21 TaxID=2788942 RepID=UPI0018AC7F72|nr:hypothetical protein [Reinekea sp. G2M2-21]
MIKIAHFNSLLVSATQTSIKNEYEATYETNGIAFDIVMDRDFSSKKPSNRGKANAYIYGIEKVYYWTEQEIDSVPNKILSDTKKVESEISEDLPELLNLPKGWNISVKDRLECKLEYYDPSGTQHIGSFDLGAMLTLGDSILYLMHREHRLNTQIGEIETFYGDYKEFLITSVEQISSVLVSFPTNTTIFHPLIM